MRIPRDFEVRPLTAATYKKAKSPATCGACGRSWDDAVVTSMTPAPSARCPFEAFHEPVRTEDGLDRANADVRTPGPWRVVVGKQFCFHDGNRVSIVVDWQDGDESGNVTVAEVWSSQDDADILDGAFIVEACNSHDALTARCARLEEALRAWIDAYECGELDKYDDAWKQARAALEAK